MKKFLSKCLIKLFDFWYDWYFMLSLLKKIVLLKFEKLSIKYQLHPKSREILYTFGQEIWICHISTNHI